MGINKYLWLIGVTQELWFLSEICTVNYLLGKVITDTHKTIIAIPAGWGCGRNVMDVGISVRFIQISLLSTLMCIFRWVLLFLPTFPRLISLLHISTVISAFISSLLLPHVLKRTARGETLGAYQLFTSC